MIGAFLLGLLMGWTTGTPVNAKIPSMKGVFTLGIYQRSKPPEAIHYEYEAEEPLPWTLGKTTDGR